MSINFFSTLLFLHNKKSLLTFRVNCILVVMVQECMILLIYLTLLPRQAARTPSQQNACPTPGPCWVLLLSASHILSTVLLNSEMLAVLYIVRCKDKTWFILTEMIWRTHVLYPRPWFIFVLKITLLSWLALFIFASLPKLFLNFPKDNLQTWL